VMAVSGVYLARTSNSRSTPADVRSLPAILPAQGSLCGNDEPDSRSFDGQQGKHCRRRGIRLEQGYRGEFSREPPARQLACKSQHLPTGGSLGQPLNQTKESADVGTTRVVVVVDRRVSRIGEDLRANDVDSVCALLGTLSVLAAIVEGREQDRLAPSLAAADSRRCGANRKVRKPAGFRCRLRRHAFGDVSDALIGYGKYHDVRERQERTVKDLQESDDVSLMRYRGGTANFLEVLDSQRSLFQSELTLAQAQNNEYQNLVQPYKALGGGGSKTTGFQQASSTNDRISITHMRRYL